MLTKRCSQQRFHCFYKTLASLLQSLRYAGRLCILYLIHTCIIWYFTPFCCLIKTTDVGYCVRNAFLFSRMCIKNNKFYTNFVNYFFLFWLAIAMYQFVSRQVIVIVCELSQEWLHLPGRKPFNFKGESEIDGIGCDGGWMILQFSHCSPEANLWMVARSNFV